MRIIKATKKELYHYENSYNEIEYAYNVIDYSDGAEYFTYTIKPLSKCKYSILHNDRMTYMNKDNRYVLKVSKEKTANQIDDIILQSLKDYASICYKF